MYVNLTGMTDKNCNDNNSDKLKKENRKIFCVISPAKFCSEPHSWIKMLTTPCKVV